MKTNLLKDSDGVLVVRCNWCMETFSEDDIEINEVSQEACPHCGKTEFLMDLDDYNEDEED